MAGAYITVLLVVVLVIWLVMPQFVSCIQALIEQAPDTLEQVLENPALTEILPDSLRSDLSSINWETQVHKIAEWLESRLDGVLVNTHIISSVFSGIVSWVFAVMFSFYLLSGKEKLAIQCRRLMDCYLKPKWRDKLFRGTALLNICFHKYIVGQCLEAVILGILCTLGMLIFQFPYAVMIGTLVGVCALVPIVGAYVGAFVGAFMILSVSPIQAILFLVFLIILQQLEGNLIYPRVVGSTVCLPGIWVLAAVTVFGALFGVVGMLIGVPITAAVYRVISSNVRKCEEKSFTNMADPEKL